MKSTHRRGDDRGSASLEAAVGVPAFLLLVGLIIFGGRTAVTHQAVESAAAEAARSASIARSSSEAKADAKQAAQASLANQDLQCLSVDITVETAAFDKPIGESGQVEVTVECRLDLSDLSVPGVPGSRVIKETMSSPVDTWRERDEASG
jgi:Flp pilus assembly protein TadG